MKIILPNVKIVSAFFSPVLLLFLLPAGLVAEDWPLTDPALKSCVEKAARKQGWQRAEQVTELRCHSLDIASLQGLEIFSGLQTLSLHNNDISEINVEAWPQLEVLNIAKNKLTRLELSNLSKLSEVYIFGNQIERLSLENLPKLTQFKANSNGMRNFSYQGLPAVSKIYLFDNELEMMDIYQLPSLSYMDVRQNPMPDELYEEMDKLKGVTVLHDGNEEDWQ